MSQAEKYKQKLGKYGEDLALQYLQQHSYAIVQRNYRCKKGEIDLIATQKEYLVFIEVKTRRSLRYGTPLEAVTFRKQQQICRTALSFLAVNEYDLDIRFDIIAILLQKMQPPHIEHICNAFDCTA